MKKIVLIRHGQSVFNAQKIFCGWTDVDLTDKGREEARQAGKALLKQEFRFDKGYTSVLKRAIETLDIVLSEMNIENLPIERTWRLNERHYGALQGLKHQDMAEKYSPEQVHEWRRSYSTKPPLLDINDSRNPALDPKYADIPRADLPRGESLEDTVKRVIPFWTGEIVPNIKAGKSLIVSASGNSLRALIKYIDNISDEEIVGLEIKTGTPLIYELNDLDLSPIRHYYLE